MATVSIVSIRCLGNLKKRFYFKPDHFFRRSRESIQKKTGAKKEIPKAETVKTYKVVENGVQNGIGIEVAQSLLPPTLHSSKLDGVRQGNSELEKPRDRSTKRSNRARNGY